MQNQVHTQQAFQNNLFPVMAEKPSMAERLEAMKTNIAATEYLHPRQIAERGLYDFEHQYITFEELENVVKDCQQSMIDPINYGAWVPYKTGEYRRT